MDLTTNDDLQAVLLQRSSARKMKAVCTYNIRTK